MKNIKNTENTCTLFKNCPFFEKYKDKHHLACTNFIDKYCMNNGKNCARLEFRQKNNSMPPAELMPNGKDQIEIPKEILENCTLCSNNFACLQNNLKDICKITKQIQNELYFIKCLHNKQCEYMDVFGETKLCTCPVRLEIYDRYEI